MDAADREPPPALTGLLETALYVADLDRSRDFYQRVFGFDALRQDHRFCALSAGGREVLLLFRLSASDQPSRTPGGTIPAHGGQGRLHLAFAIPADALAEWEARLARLHVAVESRVRASRGGTSLYFRDPDDHLVELATPGLWATY
jgi:catechol 2,3-dioxygenase-like lactoylglutathione lyase family enzyme